MHGLYVGEWTLGSFWVKEGGGFGEARRSGMETGRRVYCRYMKFTRGVWMRV